uniref:PEGA domain-containing protein n=1 Tax=Candidatus Kentrum sp. FW TaxID=2126338 RepID=A0A450U4M7_9GAMM|nr:MAG: hypothetical protein BECKFW1821C_GA0114237_12103 [Candidatus Kentron sp. FW]
MKTKSALFGIAATVLSGCASITQGTSQIIAFTIDPVDGKCTVTNSENSPIGTVTGTSNLLQTSKGAQDLIITCNADGYDQKVFRISSSTQTAGVLGVAIDLGITDMLTGAMWKYPEHISVSLDKNKP